MAPIGCQRAFMRTTKRPQGFVGHPDNQNDLTAGCNAICVAERFGAKGPLVDPSSRLGSEHAAFGKQPLLVHDWMGDRDDMSIDTFEVA